MIEEIDFETYLYISKNKFQIFLFDKKNIKNLYNKELKIENNFHENDLNNLSKFLDDHVYMIEKLMGNFIKNIILIIESDKNLDVNIGVKKKNYNNPINQKYLENSLIDLKDLFKENYQEQAIMHIIIVTYIVDKKKYSLFTGNLNSDNLCIEVNFQSISNDLIFAFDKVLEKYQIKITRYMSGNYIKNFFKDETIELSEMAYRLKNGQNDNEVILIPKNVEIRGIFEKFFGLFS